MVRLDADGANVRVPEYALLDQRRRERWWWPEGVVPRLAVVGLIVTGIGSIASVLALFNNGDNNSVVARPVSPRAGPGVASRPSLNPAGGYAPADRPTFTWRHPATYVVFNSITDNPYYGDERAFFDGFEFGSNKRAQDVIRVHDHETLVLRVFYLNDADSSLNQSAIGTRVRILLPVGPKKRTAASAEIVANNASPHSVSDTVTFVAFRYFTVEYVPGTARIWTNALSPGRLSDSIVTHGTLIGFEKMDGVIPPDVGHGSGWVTIRVKVYMAAN